MANSRTGIALLLSQTMMFFFWGSLWVLSLHSAKDAAHSPQLQFIAAACVENRARKHVQASSEASGIINGRGMENTSLDKTLLKCGF